MMLTIDGKMFNEEQCEVWEGSRGVKMYRTQKGNFIMVHQTKRSKDGYKATVVDQKGALNWLVSAGHAAAAMAIAPEQFKMEEL